MKRQIRKVENEQEFISVGLGLDDTLVKQVIACDGGKELVKTRT